MSRIVTHNESWSGYPTSYDSENSNVSNVTYVERGYKSVENANSQYATFTPGSNGAFYAFYNFQTPNIPSNSVINSLSCQARSMNYTQGGRGNGGVSLCAATTPKGTETSLSQTVTTYTLDTGTWLASEFNNGVKLRLYLNRTKTGFYNHFYGSTLTINYSWDETFYAISTSSSVQGIGISAQDAEVTSGGTDVITVTGISDLSDIKLMDNGTDVTSSLVVSGSNYTYTLNNVDSDHSITIEESAIPTIPSFVKKIHNINKLVKHIRKTVIPGRRNQYCL